MRGAHVGRMVVLGDATVSGNLRRLSVGDQTSLGRCEIALHDEVRIGRCVVINDGARLLIGSHALDRADWRLQARPITIEDYAWIAVDALILPGVTVGRGAVVGAGAVVRRDVPAYAVAVGNPATMALNRRTTTLHYSPALLVAAFEAWVGQRSIE